MTEGKLYIIPTPIGNLDDITFRAVRILKGVDRILAEDTRHTRILCNHYAIVTPLTSFNDHNAAQRLPGIIQSLRGGAQMALVSDAGTPGISDPGLPLIRAVISASVPLEVLPGASAVTTALSGSGFPLGRFVFEGFLPRKGKLRKQRLAQMTAEERSIVLFESPRRLLSTLMDLQQVGCADRSALVARELTKIFETWHRGTIQTLTAWFEENPPKGEIVLVIKGREEESFSAERAGVLLEVALAEGNGVRQAAQSVASLTGLPRTLLYKMALEKNVAR